MCIENKLYLYLLIVCTLLHLFSDKLCLYTYSRKLRIWRLYCDD